MPKVINLPGGDTASFPDAMSNEAIEKVLREQYKPAQAPAPEREDANYSNEGRAYPAPEPTLRETIEGVIRTASKPYRMVGNVAKDAAVGIAKGMTDIPQLGDKVARRMGLHSQPLQKTETLDRMYDEAGPVAAVGRAVPGAAIMAPLGAAGGVGGLALDIGGNAAVGALDAYGEGGSPLMGAAIGGAGAAGGRVLARTLTGAKTLASKEAQQLIDQGIIPTPGQMFDGPVGNVARSVEDKLTSFPIVGDMATYARNRTVRQFGNATINEALDPLTSTKGPLKQAMAQYQKAQGLSTARIAGSGDAAIEAAQRRISAAYDSALDGMHVSPRGIDDAIGKTGEAMEGIALLDEGQAAKVAGYINQRIRPLMELGGVDGQVAKRLDSELGYLGRKYSRSVNPGDHPMGDAFYALQEHWRTAMREGTTGEANALLDAANKAHRNLLPAVKAADRAAAQGGNFTPYQHNRGSVAFKQNPTALTDTAQQVLPSRVGDSGTAGRMLLNIAAGGGALYAGPGTAAATALGALVYSPAGLRMFARGAEGLVPNGVYQRLMSLPEDQLFGYIGAMARNPQTREATERVLGRVASQMGRIYALQPGQASQADTMPPLTEEEME